MLDISDTRLMKNEINIICTSAPSPTHKPLSQSFSVSLFTPEPCSLFPHINPAMCLVPSPRLLNYAYSVKELTGRTAAANNLYSDSLWEDWPAHISLCTSPLDSIYLLKNK